MMVHMGRLKIQIPLIMTLLILFLMMARPANCYLGPGSSMMVSTMHEFSFSPKNASQDADINFNAECQTGGATFSYLVGTPEAIHDYLNGKLAEVKGTLNVTKCYVGLTHEEIEANISIFIVNDGKTSGAINITYDANNVSRLESYQFYMIFEWIISSSLYAGSAIFVLWLACKVYEHRNIKAGEIHE